MPKKCLFLLFSVFIFQWPAFPQTTVINEDFESDLNGWQFQGNWFQEPGYIFMYYHPVTYGYDFWVISPEYEIPSTGGDLIINHFIDVYMANVTNEKCEILILQDTQETVVWEYELSNGTWGNISGSDMLIPMDEFVGQKVRIKMRSYGAQSNALWGWFTFNIHLTTFFNHDLEALNLTGPATLIPGESGTWHLNVRNLGVQTTTDFSIKLFSFKNNAELASADFNGTINPGNSAEVPVNWYSDDIQNTVLYSEIEYVNDQYPNNNQSESKFAGIRPQQDFTVLLWDNDNNIATITNPETGELEQPNTGIENALLAAGVQYDKFNILPTDPGQYDIIFATMGCYCLS